MQDLKLVQDLKQEYKSRSCNARLEAGMQDLKQELKTWNRKQDLKQEYKTWNRNARLESGMHDLELERRARNWNATLETGTRS